MVVCVCKSVARVLGFHPFFFFLIQKYADLLRIQEKNKRAKIKSKKITDVLLSSDTTKAQGFLQENGDDCALVSFRDDEDEEEVMEGAGIPWSMLGDAVGAEEQLELRRSARVRELNEEEFESEEEEFDKDEDEYEMDEP
jgi:hypothetical protein